MSDPVDQYPNSPVPSETQNNAVPAPQMPDGPWLQGLNAPQLEAVTSLDGPLLVLSGAGTGKTRVLTARLAQLVATRKAAPWNILAVTFTNKAAREMKARILQLVGPMAEQVMLGTFHSIAARMLRRHAELVGLKSDFTILDMDDQNRLLKQLLESEQIDTKRWPPRMLAGIISGFKDRGLVPARVSAAEASDFANGRAAELYGMYQARLKTLNAVDFGDLLLHMLTIFREHEDVLRDYQSRLTYIMVDEYQTRMWHNIYGYVYSPLDIIICVVLVMMTNPFMDGAGQRSAIFCVLKAIIREQKRFGSKKIIAPQGIYCQPLQLLSPIMNSVWGKPCTPRMQKAI